jgi:hypothetical protein
MIIMVAIPLLLGIGGLIAVVGLVGTIARLARADMRDDSVLFAPGVNRVEIASRPDSKASLGSPRLLRLDRTTIRLAGPSGVSLLRKKFKLGDYEFVLLDGGVGVLTILAEYSSAAAGSEVLPITVTTQERVNDYFLIFRVEDSGKWVAVVEVPGFEDWAEILIHDARDRASLTADDADTAARSVAAAPKLWETVWRDVALARPEGDPLRKAIVRARDS